AAVVEDRDAVARVRVEPVRHPLGALLVGPAHSLVRPVAERLVARVAAAAQAHDAADLHRLPAGVLEGLDALHDQRTVGLGPDGRPSTHLLPLLAHRVLSSAAARRPPAAASLPPP